MPKTRAATKRKATLAAVTAANRPRGKAGDAKGSNIRGRGRGTVRGRGAEPNPVRGESRGRGRGRGRGSSTRQPDKSLLEPGYEDTTDPGLVTVPVPNLVHPALKDAWVINTNHEMALIFDVVNPVHQFKRDKYYDSDDEPKEAFVIYDPSPESDPNITEDDERCDLKPYLPIVHV